MNFIFKLTEYQHGNQTAKFYNNALRTISAVSGQIFFLLVSPSSVQKYMH